jgi:hypothetical protein
MPTLDIDGLKFRFPRGWQATKYDDWGFYRNQFVKQHKGLKAVDVLALAPDSTAYLIEVKDYRHPDSEKPSDLPSAVADKVIHTLAALLPAKANANDAAEKTFAGNMLDCRQLRVVMHIEQNPHRKPVVDLTDLLQKTRRYLRAIDPHPKVCSMTQPSGMPWVVRT